MTTKVKTNLIRVGAFLIAFIFIYWEFTVIFDYPINPTIWKEIGEAHKKRAKQAKEQHKEAVELRQKLWDKASKGDGLFSLKEQAEFLKAMSMGNKGLTEGSSYILIIHDRNGSEVYVQGYSRDSFKLYELSREKIYKYLDKTTSEQKAAMK